MSLLRDPGTGPTIRSERPAPRLPLEGRSQRSSIRRGSPHGCDRAQPRVQCCDRRDGSRVPQPDREAVSRCHDSLPPETNSAILTGPAGSFMRATSRPESASQMRAVPSKLRGHHRRSVWRECSVNDCSGMTREHGTLVQLGDRCAQHALLPDRCPPSGTRPAPWPWRRQGRLRVGSWRRPRSPRIPPVAPVHGYAGGAGPPRSSRQSAAASGSSPRFTAGAHVWPRRGRPASASSAARCDVHSTIGGPSTSWKISNRLCRLVGRSGDWSHTRRSGDRELLERVEHLRSSTRASSARSSTV